jgi:hypothetical protein
MGARFPIPRPTETAALERVQPRRLPSNEVAFADLATTYRHRDWHGFSLLGHLLLRAIVGKAGEEL